MSKCWGPGTMVIPASTEVGQFMQQVPAGKVTTQNEILAALARKHGATIACPITTGISSWIAANAAEEQRQKGVKDIPPYWRTLKTGGLLNEKYPGGAEAHKSAYWRVRVQSLFVKVNTMSSKTANKSLAKS